MGASSSTAVAEHAAGAVVCAWCGATMKPGDERLPSSHGVCPRCAQDLVREWFADERAPTAAAAAAR